MLYKIIGALVFPPLQTVEIGGIIGGDIHSALYSSDIPLQGR